MAEQLPQQATGANIRSAINTNAEQLETVTEAVGYIIGVPSDFFLNGKINPAYLPSIPENLLPEVDIFPLFNPAKFEVLDGLIDIIGGATPTQYTVSLNITGLPADTPVTVDGEEWMDYLKSFAAGTVIDSIVPVAEGYTFSPTSAGPVTVDGNKTLNFTATASGGGSAYTDLIEQYAEADESQVNITDNDISFVSSQRARNERVLTAGVDGGLKAILSIGAAMGFGDNAANFAGRNEMSFGAIKDANTKITFFSLGSNLFESSPIAGDAIVELIQDGADWIAKVNGTQIGTMTGLSGGRKPNFFGDGGTTITDVQTYGFA